MTRHLIRDRLTMQELLVSGEAAGTGAAEVEVAGDFRSAVDGQASAGHVTALV